MVPFGASPRHQDRQSDREGTWCICYIHAHEFGQDTVREAIILDRSDSGVRVRSRSRATFPEKVRIHAPRLGLDITGHTVWQEGFDTGIAFED